jgi:hypothetical protein
MSGKKDDGDVESGGSAKGLLIMGLVGGLAIGGGGAYFMFKDNLNGAPQTEEEAPKKEEKPLQAVKFERLTVPIYSNRSGSSRFVGNFFINIDVLVRGNDNLIAVRRSEPQLQHAFIAAINRSQLMQEDSPQQLDFEKTAIVLKKKANEVLSGSIVEQVTVVEAMRIPN